MNDYHIIKIIINCTADRLTVQVGRSDRRRLASWKLAILRTLMISGFGRSVHGIVARTTGDGG